MTGLAALPAGEFLSHGAVLTHVPELSTLGAVHGCVERFAARGSGRGWPDRGGSSRGRGCVEFAVSLLVAELTAKVALGVHVSRVGGAQSLVTLHLIHAHVLSLLVALSLVVAGLAAVMAGVVLSWLKGAHPRLEGSGLTHHLLHLHLLLLHLGLHLLKNPVLWTVPGQVTEHAAAVAGFWLRLLLLLLHLKELLELHHLLQAQAAAERVEGRDGLRSLEQGCGLRESLVDGHGRVHLLVTLSLHFRKVLHALERCLLVWLDSLQNVFRCNLAFGALFCEVACGAAVTAEHL